MFSILKKRNKFFTEEEHQKILQAIQHAEKETSGEIRVFVESKCSYMDALDRAKEIFEKLNMQNTAERNAVLIYVAVKHHQLAIFGDEAIHKKVGKGYWSKLVTQMIH
ncbi:MAG TPA: TPM domain-containing protein, partial [Chitinophagaceae bacterium]|nr:TPM domain-containing protein [Chitinophagaceae bacterium]